MKAFETLYTLDILRNGYHDEIIFNGSRPRRGSRQTLRPELRQSVGIYCHHSHFLPPPRHPPQQQTRRPPQAEPR